VSRSGREGQPARRAPLLLGCSGATAAGFGRALADGVLPPSATLYAALSFLAWTLALLAGRAIAYL
jgi:hypothetical protein